MTSKDVSVGMVFGKWTAMEHSPHKDKYGWNVDGWICKCSCKKQTVRWVRTNSLIAGKSTSCGCNTTEKLVKHGMSKSKIYKSYFTMMARCYDKKYKSYKYYGGRYDSPIVVCKRWHILDNFLKDAITLPGYNQDCESLSLDRIDSNREYSPDNCRWTSFIVQQNNKRKNIYVLWNGERHTLSEISRIKNIRYSRLVNVYKWNVDKRPIEWIVERAAMEKSINFASIAKEADVPYNKLYFQCVTKKLPVEEAIIKIKNQMV